MIGVTAPSMFLILILALTILPAPAHSDPTYRPGATGEVLVLSTGTGWPGKVFVSSDEWDLSDFGFFAAADTERFALNLASWFTSGHSGNFLVYSTNFGLNGERLASTMRAAGHTWTVRPHESLTLEMLLAYDAIFVAGNSVDNTLLIDYVRAGGGVYLAGGTGWGGAADEARRWNTFLGAFGLTFEPVYNPFAHMVLPVVSDAAPLRGVARLYHYNGNSMTVSSGRTPGTRIVNSYGGYALHALHETQSIPVTIDLKPGVCPKTLTVGSRSEVRMTIVGTETLHVSQIDPRSVRLLGVPTRHDIIVDIAAPGASADRMPRTFECRSYPPDGYPDLTVAVDSDALVDAAERILGRSVENAETLALTVTGKLAAGTPIVGEALVVIRRGRNDGGSPRH